MTWTGEGGSNRQPLASWRVTVSMSFQELVLNLQAFWSSQGCLIVQPYDTEKGAGTLSPHTFLRAIGPEPWNVA